MSVGYHSSPAPTFAGGIYVKEEHVSGNVERRPSSPQQQFAILRIDPGWCAAMIIATRSI